MGWEFYDPLYCDGALGYLPIGSFIPGIPTDAGIVVFIAGILNLMMSLITIYWIKHQELQAQYDLDDGGGNGSDNAAKSVIFPIFVKILWFSATMSLFSAMISLFMPLQHPGEISLLNALLYSSYWALQHGLLEGVALLLMQKGCGRYSLWRTARYISIWTLIVFIGIMAGLFASATTYVAVTLTAIRDVGLFIFYGLLWLAPQRHLYRRPALIFYSKCWFFVRLMAMIFRALELARYVPNRDIAQMLGACAAIFLSFILYSLVQPVILYLTFLNDSRWWQGIDVANSSDGTGADSMLLLQPEQQQQQQQRDSDLRAALLGTEYSLSSAQSLANAIDSMRCRSNVRMLNFAHIFINTQRPLGCGSFSKVFAGRYGITPCAIKLIYTMDLTTDVIQRVAAEASILSAIRHKNVVNIYGVTVFPPSVCLVLEVCSFGSLSDIIRGYGFDWNTSQRPPLHLGRTDLLYLALGCARGLAAVHSYSSSICHRDVKSFNFLVDHQFNVKIADMELGGAEKRNIEADGASSVTNLMACCNICPRDGSSSGGGQAAARMHSDAQYSAVPSDDKLLINVSPSNTNATQLEVETLLANWLAPEVIQCGYFQQPSDVFALGTVIWEIMTGNLPFDGEDPHSIRQKICTGYQHPMPADLQHSPVGEILRSCWQWDPQKRPTAEEVAMDLEVTFKSSSVAAQLRPTAGADDPVTIAHVQELLVYYEANYRRAEALDRRFNALYGTKLHDNSNVGAQRGRRRNRCWGWCFTCSSFPLSMFDTLAYCCCCRRGDENVPVDYHVYAKTRALQYRRRRDDRGTGAETRKQQDRGSNLDDDDLIEEGNEEDTPMKRYYTINGWCTEDKEDADSQPRISELSNADSEMLNPSMNQQTCPSVAAHDNDADEGLSLKPSSVHEQMAPANLLSRMPSLTSGGIQRPGLPANVLKLLQSVREQGYWSALQSSSEAWAVVTSEAPYIVLHATKSWFSLFRLQCQSSNRHTEQLYSLYSLLNRFSGCEGLSNSRMSRASAPSIKPISEYGSNSYVHDWSHESLPSTSTAAPSGAARPRATRTCGSCINTQSAQAFLSNMDVHRRDTERSINAASEGSASTDMPVYGVLCFKLPAVTVGAEHAHTNSTERDEAQSKGSKANTGRAARVSSRRISSVASVVSSTSSQNQQQFYHLMCSVQAYALPSAPIMASGDLVEVPSTADSGRDDSAFLRCSPIPETFEPECGDSGSAPSSRRNSPVPFSTGANSKTKMDAKAGEQVIGSSREKKRSRRKLVKDPLPFFYAIRFHELKEVVE